MRYLKFAPLFALPIAFALTLGAAPQTAEAGLCKKLGKPNQCVNTADVKNGNLKAGDLRDEPGVDFAPVLSSFTLAGGDEIVTSVTITAPRPGFVVATASGYFMHTAAGRVDCEVSPDATNDNGEAFSSSVPAGSERDPFSSSVVFEVLAGDFTVNLVCSNSTSVSLFRTKIHAIYFPTRY